MAPAMGVDGLFQQAKPHAWDTLLYPPRTFADELHNTLLQAPVIMMFPCQTAIASLWITISVLYLSNNRELKKPGDLGSQELPGHCGTKGVVTNWVAKPMVFHHG